MKSEIKGSKHVPESVSRFDTVPIDMSTPWTTYILRFNLTGTLVEEARME